MDKIGEKLYHLRKKNGVSQEELAELIGVSRQSIHKWEVDKVQPTKENLLAVCHALNVNEDYFYGDENSQNGDLGAEVVVAKSTVERKVRFIILLTIIAALFLGSLLEAIAMGFTMTSDNRGYLTTSTVLDWFPYGSESDLFIIFTALSVILLALEIFLIFVYIRKVKSKSM